MLSESQESSISNSTQSEDDKRYVLVLDLLLWLFSFLIEVLVKNKVKSEGIRRWHASRLLFLAENLNNAFDDISWAVPEIRVIDTIGLDKWNVMKNRRDKNLGHLVSNLKKHYSREKLEEEISEYAKHLLRFY